MAADKKSLEKVAKHLRFNLKTKAAVLKREKVEYFTGSSAVDTLMNSKWAVKTDESEQGGESRIPKAEGEENKVEFHSRVDAVSFCNYLIDLQYMTRVEKVLVANKTAEGSNETGDEEGTQTSKTSGKSDDQDTKDATQKKGSKTKSKGEKKKKRYRLAVHPKQQFRDSDDIYIWKYNPPSMMTYIIGFVVVLGAIAWTLQPLWPESTRVAMWYVAMAAACIIGALLVLMILRWFLYGLILVATIGKVHFWVFPNLNEEKYGFVDSFKPLYSVERSGDDS